MRYIPAVSFAGGAAVSFAGVAAAYAFPLPAGDRGEVVGAALVVARGAEPRDEAILAHCREVLSGYKRPEGILLLQPEQVPMTGTGKVQKNILREKLIDVMKQQGRSIVRWS